MYVLRPYSACDLFLMFRILFYSAQIVYFVYWSRFGLNDIFRPGMPRLVCPSSRITKHDIHRKTPNDGEKLSPKTFLYCATR